MQMEKWWLGLFLLIISATGSWAAGIGIYPSTIEVRCGESFTVDVVAKAVQDLMGVNVKILTSGSLGVISITEGTLFTDNGQSLFFENHTEQDINICMARFASLGNSAGVNGTGTIATICFVAQKSGTITLQVSSEVDFRDSHNQSISNIAIDNKAVVVVTAAPDIIISPNPYEADKAVSPDIVFSNLEPETIIQIHTLSGEFIERLEVNKNREATWCVKDIASGVYFCVIFNKEKRIVKKVGVIK